MMSGALAKGGSERRPEVGVDAHLDLLDDAALIGVLEFDRILDRDDVFGITTIDLLNQSRHRRGLA
jgi:hypothetical protein